MKKQIITEIVINASPEKVWNIFSDFNSYPFWNPLVKSIEGTVAQNNTIKVQVQNMQFRPKVLVFQKNKELKWLGHLWFKGLFDGEHKFELQENRDGSTLFIQSESFSGILVGLFSQKLDNNTRKGFETMNQKLKERVEQLENV
jgi:hypothetical protein